MTPWPQVDFAKLTQEMRQNRYGQDDLSIWGGRCAEESLMTFLQGWNLVGMSCRIWEYVSEIVFEQHTLPQNVALLERGRLFGKGGDLEVRRDGQEFIWRFIGPPGVTPPAGANNAQNYWESHSGGSFYMRKETALLWGKWNGSRWHDDRVGADRLEYPVSDGWQRVQIHYRTFSCAGQVELVWYTGLSAWKEDDNG